MGDVVIIMNYIYVLAVLVCVFGVSSANPAGKENAKLVDLGVSAPAPRPEGAVNTIEATAEFNITATFGQGWVYAPVMSALNSACYLTYVSIGGTGGCEVFYDPKAVMWYVFAYSPPTAPQDGSTCKTRCIKWS